jgi:sugar O-acyltransferase (sialic acid O-acetyltransferase NeuD family)
MTDFGRFIYPPDDFGLDVFIFGAGETGRIAFRGFHYDSPFNFKGFVIDDKFSTSHPKELYGFPVTVLSDFSYKSSFGIFVAISAQNLSQNRAEQIQKFTGQSFRFVNYISSRAFVDTDAVIGKNVMVLENNTIQSEVCVGDGTLIWSGNHIGHQTRIGRNNFLTSHVCIGGGTLIGNQNYFGMNCTVRDQITIEDEIVIGSNSFVNRNLLVSGVYVGTPVKLLEGRNARESV